MRFLHILSESFSGRVFLRGGRFGARHAARPGGIESSRCWTGGPRYSGSAFLTHRPRARSIAKADVAQTAFEIQAMLLAGNFQFVMTNDPIRLKQARQGVEHVLARLAIRDERKKKGSAR